MIPFAGIITLAIGLLALADWRRALLGVIVIGVLQDALRKLTPGAPAFYIVWATAVYLAVAAIAIFGRSLPPLRTIYLHDRLVKNAWFAFFVLIALQMLNSLVRTGNPVVPLFGAMFYLGPVAAMLLACGYFSSERQLRRFLAFYVLVLLPTCLTVYLSPAYQHVWPILADVGTFTSSQILIYDVGTILQSYSGVLRTGEIAAWHAATVAIFLITFSFTARRRRHWLITAVLVALMIGVIILTGRRKMLMALTVFFVVQWALLAWLRKGMGKVAVLIILVGTLSSYSLTMLEPSSAKGLYFQRSATVFGEAGERVEMAIDLMKWAFIRSGGLGLGAGSAAQGARYGGVDPSEQLGGAAESGLGMIMGELGILGVLISLWLLAVISRNILRNLKVLASTEPRLMLYQVSFISFMVANMTTFTVATQVYGDFFVLIILGTVVGFMVRINNVAYTGTPASRNRHGTQAAVPPISPGPDRANLARSP